MISDETFDDRRQFLLGGSSESPADAFDRQGPELKWVCAAQKGHTVDRRPAGDKGGYGTPMRAGADFEDGVIAHQGEALGGADVRDLRSAGQSHRCGTPAPQPPTRRS